ncbi:MAG: hypothetical protein ACR2G4_10265 [Pyrinomonadaceae bacterium]
MKFLTEQRQSDVGFNLNRWLLYTRTFLLLTVITVGFSACADDDDTTGGKPGNPAATSSTNIDPKSLVNVNSETFFALDEIGAQLPKPNVPIAVNTQQTPTIIIRGWAVDQRVKGEAGGVIINVDGQTDVVANYGMPRPDVAANLKNPDYTNSGFRATIDTSTLDKGRHTLTMRVITADQKGYYEQKQKYDLDIQ